MRSIILDDAFLQVLASANSYMRAGRYSEAVNLYASLMGVRAELDEHIHFNLLIAAQLLLNPHEPPSLTTNKNELKVIPLNQLAAGIGSSSSWLSTGDDPYFKLDFDDASQVTPGWYSVGMLIDCKRRRNSARFYLDYGGGYSEESSFVISYLHKSFTNRVIYIKRGLKSVRFDPLEYPGDFAIKLLRWDFLTEESATAIMIDKIKARSPDPSSGASNKTLQSMSIDEIFDNYRCLVDSFEEVSSYREWIENIESQTIPTKIQVSKMLYAFDYKPLISVLVPVFNTGEKFLRECLDSVINQSYRNWELCIADDASTNPEVVSVLNEYQIKDNRIKVLRREKNGHISRASNTALGIAKGEYIALLDHDDTLAADALLYIVEALNETPDAQVVYTDEDKLSVHGVRIDPHFKSDWNPDLFYSHNYMSHLGVYKKTLLDAVGGFRPGYEGSQDYDLMLRCLTYVTAEQIVHVPRVLYHWRSLEGSTALSSNQKNYTSDAGIKALKYHFAKKDSGAKVFMGHVANTYRIRWPLPKKNPLVSLIIPTRDRRSLTEVAVRSILSKTTYRNYEIIILDNGSTEADTLEFFDIIQREDKRVRVIRYDYPFNYSAINNYGVLHAKGEIIGLVNNDVEIISADWLREMVSIAVRPEVGCVGAKLYYSNDTVQHAGVICSLGGVAGHSHKHFPRSHPGYFHRLMLPQNLSAVTAACLVVRKQIFEAVGGLDEVNLKVAFNDVDFCLKVSSVGYLNVWTPHAELYHYESVSRGAEDSPDKIARFQSEVIFMKQKWTRELERDRFYNHNLTQDREDFSLRSH
jgi:glycosyltransferase involved in cell wall biosynthesis